MKITQKIRQILGAISLSVVLLAALSLGTTLAQTTPTGDQPATEPAWFKDVPTYDKLEKLEVDDSVLSVLNLSRSQAYFQTGLTDDPVATVADFYKTKLTAAGWELQQLQDLPFAKELTFVNSKQNNAQLIVLAAGKQALQLLPQLKSLDARVPTGKTILALVAPTKPLTIGGGSPAAKGTPPPAVGSANQAAPAGVTAPAWLKDIPQYNVQNITIDSATLQALGVDPTQNYVQAGLTPDGVKTVADFYTSKLTALGWDAPDKSNLGSPDLGQILNFQNDKLMVLIVNKSAMGFLPQAKAFADRIPNGQTLVALIAPADVGPRGGTACQVGQECQVGPYKVRVTFDRTSFNTTDNFVNTIERLDSGGGDWGLQAESVPSRGTAATAVPFTGDFERGSAAKRQVTMNFPISGNWYVYLTIKGSAGEAVLYIPQKVEPPARMDERLAWAIGLAPLLGIVGFAVGQWQLVRRRRQAERVTSPIPDPDPVGTGV